MASRDFSLANFEFKRNDGSGEVMACPESASAFIRANKATAKGGVSDVEHGFLIAFYSAQAAGLLDEMDLDLSGCKTDEERMLRLFDRYAVREVLNDDDGNEAGGEQDPT